MIYTGKNPDKTHPYREFHIQVNMKKEPHDANETKIPQIHNQ